MKDPAEDEASLGLKADQSQNSAGFLRGNQSQGLLIAHSVAADQKPPQIMANLPVF